jgi:hypothetical protein
MFTNKQMVTGVFILILPCQLLPNPKTWYGVLVAKATGLSTQRTPDII